MIGESIPKRETRLESLASVQKNEWRDIVNRNERFESLLSEGEKAELHHISGEIQKFLSSTLEKKIESAEVRTILQLPLQL